MTVMEDLLHDCGYLSLAVGQVQPRSPGNEQKGAFVVVLPQRDMQRGLA
jgi:hypothetical protein